MSDEVTVEVVLGQAGEEDPTAVRKVVLSERELRVIPPCIAAFRNISDLNLSRNQLTSLAGLSSLSRLSRLNVYFNNISSLEEVHHLKDNFALRYLDLRLNSVTHESGYRRYVLSHLPGLVVLDERDVASGELERAALDKAEKREHHDPAYIVGRVDTVEEISAEDESDDIVTAEVAAAVGAAGSDAEHRDGLSTSELQSLSSAVGQSLTVSPVILQGTPSASHPSTHIDHHHDASSAEVQGQSAGIEFLGRKLSPRVGTTAPPTTDTSNTVTTDDMRATTDDMRANQATVTMLKESHAVLTETNARLVMELEQWKLRYASEAALWQRNFEDLRERYEEVVEQLRRTKSARTVASAPPTTAGTPDGASPMRQSIESTDRDSRKQPWRG